MPNGTPKLGGARSDADKHVPARVGEEVDYFSRTYACWSPTHITHVDMEKCEITLHARTTPLKREEFSARVRPRSAPGRAQLEWIRSAMEGQVEKEADELFERFSDIVVEFEDQHGQVVALDALSLDATLEAGRTLDKLLGVSGHAHELKRRATQEMRRRRVELPAGWEERRAKSGNGAIYYCRVDGTDARWDWPSSDLALPQGIFGEAFREALQCVYRRYSEALSPRKPAEVSPDDYELGKRLGEGSYGEVRAARHRETGWERAIKTISRDGLQNEDDVRQEIQRLSQLDHPNIVRLYGHWKDDHAWHLVMDFCVGGELAQTVSLHRKEKEPTPIHEDHVKDIMRQILRAVTHMHGHGLMHLDLKPGNVVLMPERGTLPPAGGPDKGGPPLLTESARSPHIMVIDFGLSKLFGPWTRYGNAAGTPMTMAPEVWDGIVTPPADVFSCGCILFYMMAFRFPYDVSANTSNDAHEFWRRPPQPKPIPERMMPSDLGQQLCMSMLAVDRRDRPVASRCLEHGYLRPPRPLNDLGDCERDSGADGWPEVDKKVTTRMKRLPSKDMLYRSVALRLAGDWSANRLGSIKSAFEKFDKDGSGRLAVPEVEKMLSQLKIDPASAKKAAAAMAFQKNGFVEFTEFVAGCLHLGSDSMEKDLERMFRKADQDGDGKLDKNDLEQMFNSDFLRENPVDGIAEKVLNGKDAVTFHDFRRHFVTANLDDDLDDNGLGAGMRRSRARAGRKTASQPDCP